MTEVVRKLAARLLKAEIAARLPKDASAIEDALAPRLRLDPTSGEFFIVNPAGDRDDTKSLQTLLDEVAQVRPELFSDVKRTPTGRSDNPFVPGPSFNLTAAMALYRTDPSAARRLEAEAQKKT